jgi:uncharacterized protein
MSELDIIPTLLVCIAAFLAGFLDAIVGGGGMVTVPSLFIAFPQATIPTATLLGTNKIAALGGVSMAAVQLTKQIKIQWRWVLPAMLAAGLASALGAFSVSFVPVVFFKKLLPPILVCLLLYTVFSKKIQLEANTDLQQSWVPAVLFSVVCGFYDGVFGPGAGSFLVLLWARVYGLNLLNASAHAKWVNAASNAAALAVFVSTVPVYVNLGLMMMVCGVSGAYIGTHVSLKYGSGFVRKMLIVVVTALIFRTGYDAYLR